MIVGKIHEIISLKQSKWLEEYISFDTKNNETELKMTLKKTSIDNLLRLLLVNCWKIFAIV